MIRLPIEIDLSLTAVEEGSRLLRKKTHRAPKGLIVGSNLHKVAASVLGLMANRGDLLRLYIVDDFPADAWMIYNEEDCVYSELA